MSDPVTNAEVEDVLSSIRRLVSEDKRPLQPRKPKEGGDRLVLTPALRVEEDEDGQEEETVLSKKDMSSAQDTVGETAKQLFDPSDDMPSDVYNRQLESDFGWSGEDEALFDDLEDNSGAADVPKASDAAQPVDAKQDDPAEDYSDDPYDFADEEDAPDDAAVLKPADRVAGEVSTDEALEAARDSAAEHDTTPKEADTSEENDMFDFDILKRRSRDTAASDGDADAIEVSSSGADAPDEDRQAGMVAASKAATLSAKIAALETAIGNIADTWEPDTPGTDDYSGTDQAAMAWEDDVSHDATGLPLRSEAAQAAWQDAHPDVVMIGTARAAAAAAAAIEERAADNRTEEDLRAARERDVAAEDQAAKDRAIATARAAAAERMAADKRAAEQRQEARASAEAETLAANEHATSATSVEEAEAEKTTSNDPALDYTDDSQLLDEDALRDLVSEIVRAELQGALGERITRNVRKLVRREIHRALTAQELE